MDEVLGRLKAGIGRFRREVSCGQAEAYLRAGSEAPRPHALVVTCADSRIDPYVVTQAPPGELFVTRNIGNMVPAYGEMMGGVSAVLEYAVSALQVKHLVVCGHTDCGAMKALLNPEAVETMPTVKSWLRNAHTALSVAEALSPGADKHGDLLRVVTEQNVLLQMQHVRTHPSVAGAMARGDLTISGWMYDIAHGAVRIWEEGAGEWQAVEASEEP